MLGRMQRFLLIAVFNPIVTTEERLELGTLRYEAGVLTNIPRSETPSSPTVQVGNQWCRLH